SMADLLNGQKKNSEALQYATNARNLALSINEKGSLGRAWQIMGEAYRNRKVTDSAIFCFRQAISLTANSKNLLRLTSCQIYIADLFLDMNQYDSAVYYAQLSIPGSEKLGAQVNVGEALRIIGGCEEGKGNTAKALADLSRANEIALREQLPWLIFSTSGALSSLQIKLGDYKNGFINYQRAITYKDSIEGREQYRQLAQVEYEAKENALKAEQARKEAILEADKSRQQQQIDRQRFLIWIAAGGALLLGGLLFVALRAYRSKQRANLIIAEQKQQVEAQKLLVEFKNKEVMDSITYARRLQEAILPGTEQIQQQLPDSFVLYLPKDVVAGDFYFFVERGPLLFIAAADCTGHGVPGALVSVVCSNALRRAVNEFELTMPGEILTKTTELVLETFSQSGSQVNDGMDISLLVVNRNAKTCTWAGANRPLWTVANGEFSQLKGDARPIGHHDDPVPFTTHQLELNAGTMIYLFTDGYADQFGGASGKKFKTRHLQEALLKIAALPVTKQKEELETTFFNWKDKLEQVDDVCIVGLRLC
ncbi:MAG: SpoIIE family protein phosphatase, partial [Bacteroidia bacterium]